MSPLEQNIIDSLHLLSDEAKAKARIVLGEAPSSSDNISDDEYDEQVRVAVYKFLKI
jgi:hypothetical protein|tara:strand:+ start:349 stop:519 length:171 start_codon:yes stop_codon:yes gene_type:complete